MMSTMHDEMAGRRGCFETEDEEAGSDVLASRLGIKHASELHTLVALPSSTVLPFRTLG
jgi:hypothetical protein